MMTKTPKGLALSIGLNAVDPGHYAGWSGSLRNAEADASDMTTVARSRGFETTQLLTSHATRAAVIASIRSASTQLARGDIFLLTYSGHGGQIPDRSGDESDRIDETWCLFDGQLLDDELNTRFAEFQAGVRILVISDSCFSGTIVTLPGSAGQRVESKAMPLPLALRTYEAHRRFYEQARSRSREAKMQAPNVSATVLLLSACQENQVAGETDFNGRFTETLLMAWNAGTFRGDYKSFYKQIVRRMPPDQTPNYLVIGTPNPAFESQLPFTV